jgi:murein DD-endopeptidase MepM/ murein hydrolase activator NlpD
MKSFKFLSLLIIIILLSKSNTIGYSQTNDNISYYIVQIGDTLGVIASKFGVTINQITELNNIQNADIISPGQKIAIPGLTGISGLITPTVIQIGESFESIVIKYQIDPVSLIKLNHITSTGALYPGTELLIPLQENNPILFLQQIGDSGITFLESSARLNLNPQEILLINKKLDGINFFNHDSILYRKTGTVDVIANYPFFTENLTISPLPIKQGATEIIRLISKSPQSFTGELDGFSLFFFTNDNVNYYALQGVSAMAEQGLANLRISSDSGTVDSIVLDQNVLITSGNFETDPPLQVDPAKIDPSYTKPEEDMVRELVSHFTPEKYWTGKFESPAFYQEYNSVFGNRRTYNNNPDVTFHTGIDFAGGVSLPVISPADGKVVFAGLLPIRGNAIFIDHGLGVYSGYFHQNKLEVAAGDFVVKGQKIGEVGNTGRVDRANEYPGAGGHLHWEIWVNGVQVNPFDWLNNEYP